MWLDLSSDLAELFSDTRVDRRDYQLDAAGHLRIIRPFELAAEVARVAKWRAANRERRNASVRAHRVANLEVVRAKDREHSRRRRSTQSPGELGVK